MTIPPIFQPSLENREHLAELLKNPVLIAAIRQVTDDVRVPQSVLNTQVAELVTRRSAFHEGRASILDALAMLTRPKRESSPALNPWEHVETEHTKL
jgi:hypothetical protein